MEGKREAGEIWKLKMDEEEEEGVLPEKKNWADGKSHRHGAIVWCQVYCLAH